jgi:hypothetical protein
MTNELAIAAHDLMPTFGALFVIATGLMQFVKNGVAVWTWNNLCRRRSHECLVAVWNSLISPIAIAVVGLLLRGQKHVGPFSWHHFPE